MKIEEKYRGVFLIDDKYEVDLRRQRCSCGAKKRCFHYDYIIEMIAKENRSKISPLLDPLSHDDGDPWK